MMSSSRFDGPFWGLVLTAFVVVGSIAFFSLAAAADDASQTNCSLLSTEN